METKNIVKIKNISFEWLLFIRTYLKKGYYGNQGLGLAWDRVRVFRGDFFWAISNDVWGMKKKDFRQKVAQKNVWVASLYNLLNKSSFFLFWLEKILRDGWVWFCYRVALKRSKTHYLGKSKEKEKTKKVEEIYISPEKRQQIIDDLKLFWA